MQMSLVRLRLPSLKRTSFSIEVLSQSVLCAGKIPPMCAASGVMSLGYHFTISVGIYGRCMDQRFRIIIGFYR